jgi:hypothetical protein
MDKRDTSVIRSAIIRQYWLEREISDGYRKRGFYRVFLDVGLPDRHIYMYMRKANFAWRIFHSEGFPSTRLELPILSQMIVQ